MYEDEIFDIRKAATLKEYALDSAACITTSVQLTMNLD